MATSTAPSSDSVIAGSQGDRAVVPALSPLELARVPRAACVRHRLTAEAAQNVVAQIATLPIDIDRQVVPAREYLALALRHGLGSDGAACLEPALRAQLPVASMDGPLRAAALACGVGLRVAP